MGLEVALVIFLVEGQVDVARHLGQGAGFGGISGIARADAEQQAGGHEEEMVHDR